MTVTTKNTKTFKFKVALLKSYFDKGYGLTSIVKWMIAYFGAASRDINMTMIFGLIYIIVCFVFGYLWFELKFMEAEIEVSNVYNLFVKEMRSRYSVKRKSVYRKT